MNKKLITKVDYYGLAKYLGIKIENEIKNDDLIDPTIFVCAYKKNRFYCLTQRESDVETSISRDAFNEKTSKEDIEMLTTENHSRILLNQKLGKTGIVLIHTTLGDISFKLFYDKTPKTVENFTQLSISGKYNNVIFHRIIKNFMIQTGDFEYGDGRGGHSIWNYQFNDEFHPSLTHKPFTLSMANSGKNTNGSQFFITTTSTPHLNNKHTVFGEVIDKNSIETVRLIENIKTYKDRPVQGKEPKILNIEIMF